MIGMEFELDFNVYAVMDDEQKKVLENSQLYTIYRGFEESIKLKDAYKDEVIKNNAEPNDALEDKYLKMIAGVEDEILDAVYNIHYMMTVNEVKFIEIQKEIYEIANEFYDLKYRLFDLFEDGIAKEEDKPAVFDLYDLIFLNDLLKRELLDKHSSDDVMDMLTELEK